MSSNKSRPFFPCPSSSKSGLCPSVSSVIRKIVKCLSRALTPACDASSLRYSFYACNDDDDDMINNDMIKSSERSH